ncbi:MAG: hypothetical protein DRJ96_06510 [Thermoprotei archaeon]|nr:hypothetical protein [Thermoproteales archaeon]RLE86260.1 MAG: hypothetical protein DRJ67_07665 [Thermoprotei archaeon]RLE96467.1 MAG: hypothetical protein DRJ96_06510 [Thermoprotei archaeon]
MSSVCPYLYRDERDRFICSVSGNEVDPGLMPCLANYRECPFYTSAEEREAAPVVEEVPPPPEAPAVEAKPAEVRPAEEAEVAVEEIEEGLLKELDEIEEWATRLAERWREYEEDARKLMRMWEEASKTAQWAERAISNVIDMYEKLLDDLELRLKSGLLSEGAYRELREEIEGSLERYRRLRSEVEERVRSVERLVLPHMQRVKVAEAKPDLGKLRVSLMKLEQMYREGKVRRETYERLKRELETRIKWLEQLAGEGA